MDILYHFKLKKNNTKILCLSIWLQGTKKDHHQLNRFGEGQNYDVYSLEDTSTVKHLSGDENQTDCLHDAEVSEIVCDKKQTIVGFTEIIVQKLHWIDIECATILQLNTETVSLQKYDHHVSKVIK